MAERRHVTVVYCDLHGAEALLAQLDPEDLPQIYQAFARLIEPLIERYQGHLQQFRGDGFLAVFGYPVARENAAESAVFTSLAILDGVPRFNASLQSLRVEALSLRIGIAAGEVVIGDRIGEGIAAEEAVIGQTPNLAARLCAVADPNTVVITQALRTLLGDRFDYESQGTRALRGFEQSPALYQILRPRAVSRFEAGRGASALTALVSRDKELGLLRDRWSSVCQSDGHTVLVMGEAGIGKSRLCSAFAESVRDGAGRVVRMQCSPYYSNTALYPFIEYFVRVAGFKRSDQPTEKQEKLAEVFAAASSEDERRIRLVAHMMSIPVVVADGGLELTATRARELTHQALLGYIEDLAKTAPLLVVFEDIHWVDPSSLEWLQRAVQTFREHSILLLLTARPEFQSPWSNGANMTDLPLERLSSDAGAEMVARVVGEKPFPAEVVQQILDKTDGIPLFVEELTKSLRTSGYLREDPDRYVLTAPLPQQAVPATLKDSLMARLDQMAQAKRVAQLGAALGRSFSYDLLAAVALRDGVAVGGLRSALDDLVEGELISRRFRGSEELFFFKHALVRDAAYDSLLRRRRQTLHGNIVDTLVDEFAEIIQATPEIAAHHSYSAGRIGDALVYWLRAGREAASRSANVEAVAHLQRGLDAIRGPSPGDRAEEWELEMLIGLGPALMATRGPGSSAVAEVYDRALALGARLPESEQHFKAHWGYWRVSMNHEIGRERADRLLSLANRLADGGCRLQAHHCQWATLFHLGDHAGSLAHVARGLALYDEEAHQGHAAIYGGHDARVCGLGESALSHWLSGRPQGVADLIQAALDWSFELSHVGSIAHAKDYELLFYLYRGAAQKVYELAGAMIEFSTEQGLPDHLARGVFFRGWAACSMRDARGDQDMLDSLAWLEETGTREDFPMFYELRARILLGSDRAAEGLELLRLALEASAESGVRFWLPELHRTMGDCLFAIGGQSNRAREQYELARSLAHEQGAVVFGLRASTSFARFLAQQESAAQAIEHLEQGLVQMPSLIDIPEVRAANALRRELGD